MGVEPAKKKKKIDDASMSFSAEEENGIYLSTHVFTTLVPLLSTTIL
jgi:hypothetical protein